MNNSSNLFQTFFKPSIIIFLLSLWVSSVSNAQNTLCNTFGNNTIDLVLGSNIDRSVELINVNLAGVSVVYNSSTNTNVATLSNLTIRFVGDFEINSLTDVIFENCILNFAPGTGIHIEADHYLTLDDSKLFACQSLWEGISLDYNARINTMNDTHFEDAKIAIHSPNTARLSITDTRFNRNEIGIQLGAEIPPPPGYPAPMFPLLSPFTNNTFENTFAINGTQKGKMEAGIKIINCPFVSIGTSNLASKRNNFIEIQNGIVIESPDMTPTVSVRNALFQAVLFDGIHATDRGNLTVELSEFNNCGVNGINLPFVASFLDVNACTFNYDDLLQDQVNPPSVSRYNGIVSEEYGVNSEININNNSFNIDISQEHQNVYGVNFSGNTSSSLNLVGDGTSIFINENNFNIEGEGFVYPRGIVLQNDFPLQSSINIESNIFTIEKVLVYGILSLGERNNLTIFHNQFFTNVVDPNLGVVNLAKGMSITGVGLGQGNSIQDNTFHYSENITSLDEYQFSPFQGGIEMGYCPGMLVCNNNISNCRNGIRMTGMNSGLVLSENKFLPSYKSLVILNGHIGEQVHQGNQWFNRIHTIDGITYLSSTAFHAEVEPPNNADLSKFWVHTAQPSSFFPNNLVPNTTQFFEQSVGTPSNNCLTMFTGDPPNDTHIKIANGDLQGYSFTDADVWYAERYLYQSLMQNPNYASLSPIFTTFINANTNTSVGKFYEVKEILDDTSTTNSIQQDIKNYHLSFNQLLDDVKNIEEQFSDAVSSQLFDDRVLLLKDIQDLDSLINIKYQAYLQQKHNLYLQALSINESIMTSTLHEEYQKEYYNILLNTKANQNNILTANQVDGLTTIAEVCPKLGGPAVYQARSALPESVVAKIDGNYEECYPLSDEIGEIPYTILDDNLEESNSSNSSVNNLLKVFPNPVKDVLTISTLSNRKGSIWITNSQGENIKEIFFDRNASHEISIEEDWSSGIYFCKVLYDNGDTEIVKFFIAQ